MRFSRKVNVVLTTVVAALSLPTSIQAAAQKFLWVEHAGSVNQEHSLDIAVDPAGNSYVVGRFDGPTLALGSFTVTGGGLFVTKYDPHGNVLWANEIGPAGVDWYITGNWLPRIATDNSGNVYLEGTFYGPVDFGITNFSTSGSGSDIFLAKYDSAGNLLWARQAGASGAANNNLGAAIAVDDAGNCFVTGDCPSASLGTTNFSADGNTSIFVAKFNPTGDIVWIKGSPGPVEWGLLTPEKIAVSQSGEIYLCGEFSTPTLTFGMVTLTNTGNRDVFVTKFDAAGGVLWAKRGGGTNNDLVVGLGVDASDACYLTGGISTDAGSVLRSTVSFDGFTLTNVNFFCVKYDLNGNVVWCHQAGDFETNNVLLGWLLTSTADAAGNSYLLGEFEGVAQFDSIILTNRGGDGSTYGDYDSDFLVKYNSDGQAVWAKQFGGVYGANTEGWGIAVDAAGNCSLASYFQTTNAVFDDFTLFLTGGLNDQDVYVARVPADPPRLNIALLGNSVVLSWLTNQPDFSLEKTNNFTTTNAWLLVTNAVAVVGPQNFVTNPITSGSQFYRLRKP
jgi:hypothetical protein